MEEEMKKLEDEQCSEIKKRRRRGSRKALIGYRKKMSWMKKKVEESSNQSLGQDTCGLSETWTDSANSIPVLEPTLHISETEGPSTCGRMGASGSLICFDDDIAIETPIKIEPGIVDIVSEEVDTSELNYITEKGKSGDVLSTWKEASLQNLERNGQQLSFWLVSLLTPMLPSEWSPAVVKKNIVRVIKLNNSENACVISSVFWNWTEVSWGAFVNGKPVPHDNKLFKSIPSPKVGRIDIIANFLLQVVTKINCSTICSGICDFKEFWRISSAGFIDDSAWQASPCFRSHKCSLLVSAQKSICSKCHYELLKFVNCYSKLRVLLV